MRTVYWRSGMLAAVLLAAGVGLAACGGAGTPSVAKLGNTPGASNSGANGGRTTSTTLPKGSASELVDKWAACMRRHGDPDQADPSISTNGVISVTFPIDYHNAFDGQEGSLGGPCGNYLSAASTALRGGRPLKLPDETQTLAFAACMRGHGLTDFPEPTNGGLSINIAQHPDLNPNNPAFRHASKLCAEKAGVPGLGGSPQPGTIKTSGGGPPCNQKTAAAADEARSRASDSNGAELSSFLEC